MIPAGTQVNDPNGPFRDPKTGFVHLFMQCETARDPCPRPQGVELSSDPARLQIARMGRA